MSPQVFDRAGGPPLALQQGAAALAQDIAQRLRQAIADRGEALLVVSGGQSPLPLFAALRAQPLDWARVNLTLADERCVPADHADSNARLVREHLLQGAAAAARFIPLVQAEAPLPAPEALADWAEARLHALGPADVLVLGLGADGHTASLFPQARQIRQALDPASPRACLAMEFDEPPVRAPHARLTHTLAHLLRARHLVLLVTHDKLATLRQALAGPDARWPVSFVLCQHHVPLALWSCS